MILTDYNLTYKAIWDYIIVLDQYSYKDETRICNKSTCANPLLHIFNLHICFYC
jgi:hypothetical protein